MNLEEEVALEIAQYLRRKLKDVNDIGVDSIYCEVTDIMDVVRVRYWSGDSYASYEIDKNRELIRTGGDSF